MKYALRFNSLMHSRLREFLREIAPESFDAERCANILTAAIKFVFTLPLHGSKWTDYCSWKCKVYTEHYQHGDNANVWRHASSR